MGRVRGRTVLAGVSVYVTEGPTIDVDQADAPCPIRHYCFRVSEPDFDRVLARIQHLGLPCRSLPHGPVDSRVNTDHGGRIVYRERPDVHHRELLMHSYERQPTT